MNKLLFLQKYILFGFLFFFFFHIFSLVDKMRIQDIVVHGNKTVSEETILNHLPYHLGGIFDASKTRTAIVNLYNGLKRFRNINIGIEKVSNDFLVVHVHVEEKYPLLDVIFVNNTAISDKEIREKISIATLTAIDENEAGRIAEQIKELYLQKGYYKANVDSSLTFENGRAHAHFIINEGKRAIVKQIDFVGNTHASSSKLRSIIPTKEDWILSFLDHAGYFHAQKLEADKYFIEQYYKNFGFLHAHVIDTKIKVNEQEHMYITYVIDEGSSYIVKELSLADATKEIDEKNDLLALEFLKVGIPYSLEALRATLNNLELFWKNQGYIFAHVDPLMTVDEEKKEVRISFLVDKGEQISVRFLKIIGNRKTRRKVVLRNLLVEEGSLLTQFQLERSKYNVESLGYFDTEGVQWKMRRIDEHSVDLDLMVKEGKTGHLGIQFSYGGDGISLQAPLAGFSCKGDFSDTNLFGYGINASVNVTLSRDETGFFFHVAQPWLFDRPIFGAIDAYHRRPSYTLFHHIERGAVNEKLTGASGTLGYILQTRSVWFESVQFLCTTGFEDVAYNHPPKAKFFDPLVAAQYQLILDKEFNPGKYWFLSFYIDQDLRNHPIHTSRGHRLRLGSKIAFSAFGNSIGFYKWDIDYSWYTPIIGEQDLVFRFRGYAGMASNFSHKTIPFGELFLLGGQSNIRGFEFGQCGPQFRDDPIGGRKGLFVTADFIAPLLSDLSVKLVAFYNGGAGFDNPYADLVDKTNMKNNNFDYRHAVGFGIRLLRPTPISIDWGFKIDPRKNKNNPKDDETPYEIHFTMSYAF